jgi:hypothetical protein
MTWKVKYPGTIVHAIAVTIEVMSKINDKRIRNTERMMEIIEGLSFVFYSIGFRKTI